VLAARQYADWRELRFQQLNGAQARRAVAELAAHLRDALDAPPDPHDRSAAAIGAHVIQVFHRTAEAVGTTDPDAADMVNLLVDALRDAGRLPEPDVRTLRWVCQSRLSRPPDALRESAAEPPEADPDVDPAPVHALRGAAAASIDAAAKRVVSAAGDAQVAEELLRTMEEISSHTAPGAGGSPSIIDAPRQAVAERLGVLSAAAEEAEREAARARERETAQAREQVLAAQAAAEEAEREAAREGEAAQAREHAAAEAAGLARRVAEAEAAKREAQGERDAAVRELHDATIRFDQKVSALKAQLDEYQQVRGSLPESTPVDVTPSEQAPAPDVSLQPTPDGAVQVAPSGLRAEKPVRDRGASKIRHVNRKSQLSFLALALIILLIVTSGGLLLWDDLASNIVLTVVSGFLFIGLGFFSIGFAAKAFEPDFVSIDGEGVEIRVDSERHRALWSEVEQVWVADDAVHLKMHGKADDTVFFRLKAYRGASASGVRDALRLHAGAAFKE
jgi:hypothetical protein